MFLRRSSSLAAVVIVTAGTLACSGSSSSNCIPLPTPPVHYMPAVVVGVSDSITGKPVADSASGTVRTISANDSLRHWTPPDSVLYGDLGVGTYAVMVQRPGYLPWYRYNVVVAAGNCGAPISTNLTARLQPTG